MGVKDQGDDPALPWYIRAAITALIVLPGGGIFFLSPVLGPMSLWHADLLEPHQHLASVCPLDRALKLWLLLKVIGCLGVAVTIGFIGMFVSVCYLHYDDRRSYAERVADEAQHAHHGNSPAIKWREQVLQLLRAVAAFMMIILGAVMLGLTFWWLLPGGDECLRKLHPVSKYTKIMLMLHWLGSLLLLILAAVRYWVADYIIPDDAHLADATDYTAVPLGEPHHTTFDGRPEHKDAGHRAMQSLLDGAHANETPYYARMDPEVAPEYMGARFEAVNHGSVQVSDGHYWSSQRASR